MSFKIKIPTTSVILLFLTILSMEDFAELVPTEEYIIPGAFRVGDISVIFAIIFFLWGCFGIKSPRKVSFVYWRFIVAFFLISLVSSISAYYLFGQSIIRGFLIKRKLLSCFLLYFTIVRLLKLGRIKYEQFIHVIFAVVTFELIVYTLQYFLIDVITFTYIDTSEVRFESARLRFPYLMPLVLGLYCLNKVMLGKVRKTGTFAYIAYTAWTFFLLVFICKHRAPSIILVCVLCLAYLLWKKNLSTKALLAILAVLIIVAFASNSELLYHMYNESLQVIFQKSTKGDTLSIRKLGQIYYLQRLTKSPFFGFGNPHNDAALYGSGSRFNFYLGDNGLIGFTYIYGIAGLIWLVLLFLKSYSISWKLYQKKLSYLFLLYFAFETANLYIGMHWYYLYPLPFVIVLIMLDYEFTTFKHRVIK